MKRKVGLIIGYNGDGYHGLQFNGKLKTIEFDIIQILLKRGCITEMNSLDASKISLKECSRTDKGVHSSFNLITVKIIREPTEQLFKELKDDFKDLNMILYKIVRVSKRFIGYKSARSRIYKYLIPTYFIEKADFEEECAILESKSRENHVVDEESTSLTDSSEDEKSNNEFSLRIKEKFDRIFRKYDTADINKLKEFKSENMQNLNLILQNYIGTHGFHNFTIKRSTGDPKRIIRSITLSEPFYNEEIEYVEVVIHGQSFLLHQIRKMISFAVLNIRYVCDVNLIKENFITAFNNKDVHIPNSPSQYLFLNRVFFDDHNLKCKDEDKIEINEEEQSIFEQEVIYPSMLKKENILEWFKYFDAVHFHHKRFQMFKKENIN